VKSIEKWVREHLFDRAPIAIAVLDGEHRIRLANEAFTTLFGPWEGKTCHDLLKGNQGPCERCTLDWAMVDGKTRVCDDRLLVGGHPAHFVVRVAPLGDGEAEEDLALWMASNVNEAISLRRENELLFEKTPCYVTVLDRDLRIVRANRRMREAFGKAWGHPCYAVYKRRDRPCRVCPALQAFQDGQDHSAAMVGVKADGSEAHYVVTASPLAWEGGEGQGRVTFVIEIATDVTEMKILEREKLEAERLAAVGQTVAGLAHGIKNILMGMEGGVYVMRSGLEKGDGRKVDRGMEMLSRNVERISSLAKNLLSFSKGVVPRVALEDPARPAREVADLYASLAQREGIRFETDFPAGLVPAPMDREGIHTCLANLVSNALDACKAGDSPEPRVRMRLFERHGALVYEVEDNGCGMDYEVKSKIFTTFFTTKGAGGTGLGLLTTRKIVQEHGGKVEVETSPGKGTTFRLVLPRNRLPRCPEEAPEGSVDAGAPAAPAKEGGHGEGGG